MVIFYVIETQSHYRNCLVYIALKKLHSEYVFKTELYQLQCVQLHVKEVANLENHCVSFEASDYE